MNRINTFSPCYFLVALLFLLWNQNASAQLIIADPAFPLTGESVTITFNASLGSGGLAGYAGDVYAHIGVITENSTGSSDWQYVKTAWGENTPETKLTRVGFDTYSLIIGPNIRDYYGVPTNEVIEKLAMVFRSDVAVGGSYLEGKTAALGDIFVDVFEGQPGFQSQLLFPEFKNNIVQPAQNIPVKVQYSASCAVTVYDNGTLIDQATNILLYESSITPPDDEGHVIEIIGISNNDTASVNFTYLQGKNPIIEALPSNLKPGLNQIDETNVILVLDAPGKTNALLHTNLDDFRFNSARWLKQTPDQRYFWSEVDISALNGAPFLYNYIVDEDIVIADPMAEAVLDRNNDVYIDESTFTDLPDFPDLVGGRLVTMWEPFNYTYQASNYERPEKEDLVIYEILLRDFLESHSYQDLIDTIPYLNRLGVNAIELMPINEFEGNISWGYNPSFHGAVDKYYGRPEQLKELIDVCHQSGIAVIADVVFNHVFSQSPLAALYWDNANFRPAANNPWLNVEAKHPFNVGYDMNHEYSGTQEWMDAVLARWLTTYQFDGFRFDLSKGFTQINSGGNVGQWGQYDASRIALLKRMADALWAVDSDAYIILEHFAENTEEKELSDYGMMIWGNMTGPYGEASLGFHTNNKSDLTWSYFGARGWDDPHVIAYMESHDEERMMYKNMEFGNSTTGYDVKDEATALQRIALASTFFYTIPGPKMLWQFGELGFPYSINRCVDGTVNNNCRLDPKPIRWDYLNQSNRIDLFTTVSDLIHFKTSQSDFIHNAMFNYDLDNNFKWMKMSDSDLNAVVMGNFDVKEINAFILFQHTGWWFDFFTGDSIEVTNIAQTLSMAPGEYVMYFDKKIKPNSIDPNSATSNQQWVSDAIHLFPNPTTTDAVTISYQGLSIESIELLDMQGRTILIEKRPFDEAQISLSLPSGLTSGLYFVRVYTDKGVGLKQLAVASN